MDDLNKFSPLNFPPPSLPHMLPFVSSPPALPHSSSLLSPPLSTPLCISPFLFLHSSSPSFPNKFPPSTLCLPRHPVITLSSPPFRTLRYLLPFRPFLFSSPSYTAIHCICPRLLSSFCLSPLFPLPLIYSVIFLFYAGLLTRQASETNLKHAASASFFLPGHSFFWVLCFIFFSPSCTSLLPPSLHLCLHFPCSLVGYNAGSQPALQTDGPLIRCASALPPLPAARFLIKLKPKEGERERERARIGTYARLFWSLLFVWIGWMMTVLIWSLGEWTTVCWMFCCSLSLTLSQPHNGFTSFEGELGAVNPLRWEK